MPFQMTHLRIAQEIYKLHPSAIKNLPQFYLGTVAPDAVHNRSGYISAYKKASHLCVGNEPWGMLTNNEEWTENVLSFLQEHKNADHYDFTLGVVCHILSDIYNNMTVWTPFRLKYPVEGEKGYNGLYYQESEKVEIELSLDTDNEKNFWMYLRNSTAVDFSGIIFSEEIKKHKENILYRWYKDKEHQDLSRNETVTMESTMDFIKNATEFIVNKMAFSHL